MAAAELLPKPCRSIRLRHLVVGCGEVGRALRNILACDGHDPMTGETADEYRYDVLHICFPYNPDFAVMVRYYRNIFSPAHIVIHSTVAIGTSDRLDAHHSPVRGKHPHLEESMRVFVKYVGGPHASALAEEFRIHGIDAVPVASARVTEAGKLLDLMQYGASIQLEKEIHRFCEENGIDFEVAYTAFNQTYNRGYLEMGNPEFMRPILRHVPGPIGGHCVVQSMALLDTETARRIRQTTSELETAQR